MSVASQSGSKVLVEILDVMLSLSLSLRAITPGCGGGGIWMVCSLVAWEEEEDDAWDGTFSDEELDVDEEDEDEDGEDEESAGDAERDG